MIDPQFCMMCRNNLMTSVKWWVMYLTLNGNDRSRCLVCQHRGVE
jgi:hypothetical protein